MAQSNRRAEILALLAGNGAGEPDALSICRTSVEVTNMTGGGLMLMSGDIPRGSICATDDVSALIEELQYALGEGPCIDAFNFDRAVLEPDLASPVSPRWLAFTRQAVEAGARAVFGFPLQIGGVRLGALNLYRDEPGPMTDSQHGDALVLAGIAAQAILVMQAGAQPGQLATELERTAEFESVVHQASGMVAAQLDASVAHALIRLRAYAFGNGRSLRDVAKAVVARELRFNAGNGEKDPTPIV